MNIQSYVAALLAAAVLTLPACSLLPEGFRHVLNRGTVVEVNGTEAVVGLGFGDGAEAGEKLTVYRLQRQPIGGPGKGVVRFAKVHVGTAQIGEVLDEHYSKATITSGNIKVDNLVAPARR